MKIYAYILLLWFLILLLLYLDFWLILWSFVYMMWHRWPISFFFMCRYPSFPAPLAGKTSCLIESFLKDYLFILCVWAVFFCVYLCTTSRQGAAGGQERTLALLELELWTVETAVWRRELNLSTTTPHWMFCSYLAKSFLPFFFSSLSPLSF